MLYNFWLLEHFLPTVIIHLDYVFFSRGQVHVGFAVFKGLSDLRFASFLSEFEWFDWFQGRLGIVAAVGEDRARYFGRSYSAVRLRTRINPCAYRPGNSLVVLRLSPELGVGGISFTH